MDIILEVFDTFALDRAYATLLPLAPSVLAFNAVDQFTSPNATWSSMKEAGTPAAYQYHYQPASEYLSFEPSTYAYMSKWPRDNIFRQYISLFLITWWVDLQEEECLSKNILISPQGLWRCQLCCVCWSFVYFCLR